MSQRNWDDTELHASTTHLDRPLLFEPTEAVLSLWCPSSHGVWYCWTIFSMYSANGCMAPSEALA